MTCKGNSNRAAARFERGKHRRIATLCRCLLAAALALSCLILPALAEGEETVELSLLLRMEGSQSAQIEQCSLGAAVADALCWATGADVAAVPADDLSKNLLAGARTLEEFQQAVSDEEAVATVSVTPAQLKEFLEVGVSHLTLDEENLTLDEENSAFGGFPQVGGVSYRCDLSAPVGSRILAMTLSDGTQLELDDATTALTLAAPMSLLDGSYGYPALAGGATATELTLPLALYRFVAAGGVGSDFAGSSTVTFIGAANDSILGSLPVGWLALAAIAILFLTGHSREEFLDLLRARWSGQALESGKSA
jgi:hypothetical protein